MAATHGRVALLTIDRPQRANSISFELADALVGALLDAEGDPDIGAIVLTGSGERVFCSGADIKASANADGQAPKAGMRKPMGGPGRNLYEVVLECAKPVIAAINGSAVGGGFELALACDLRVADEHTTFALPEAKRGMGAHFASVVLPQLIPRAIALEMLFTGEPMTAAAIERWGLLNRIVPTGQCVESALALAEAIARNAPLSLRRIKAHAHKSQGLPLAAALRLDDGPSPYESEDRVEGFRAFLEKREPVWKGR